VEEKLKGLGLKWEVAEPFHPHLRWGASNPIASEAPVVHNLLATGSRGCRTETCWLAQDLLSIRRTASESPRIALLDRFSPVITGGLQH
jgi:hypothetical protein